jgi:hypothetical protein
VARPASLKVGTDDFTLCGGSSPQRHQPDDWASSSGARCFGLIDSTSRSSPAAPRCWRDCGP